MNPYQPKLSHVVFISLLSLLLGYFWALTEGKVSTVLGCAALAFVILAVYIAGLVGESSHYWSVTRYLEALVKVEPDLRNALAFHVPSLRLIATRGKVQTLFEDTNVSADHFRLFLMDSGKTPGFTVPRRDWDTAERPRWAWDEIYEWLVRHDRVMPDSAAGSKSYQWRGTSYQNLLIYYLGTSIPKIDENTRVFASEDD